MEKINPSSLILRRPAAVYPDPIRGGEDVLVLCSVYNPDDTPHATNTRALLERLLTPAMEAEKPLYGFEQARSPPLFWSTAEWKHIAVLLGALLQGMVCPGYVSAALVHPTLCGCRAGACVTGGKVCSWPLGGASHSNTSQNRDLPCDLIQCSSYLSQI